MGQPLGQREQAPPTSCTRAPGEQDTNPTSIRPPIPRWSPRGGSGLSTAGMGRECWLKGLENAWGPAGVRAHTKATSPPSIQCISRCKAMLGVPCEHLFR